MAYKDREKAREYCRQWRLKNKEYFRKWRKNNKEKCRAAVQSWKDRNKDYSIAQTKLWVKNHPWARHHSAAKNRCLNPRNYKYERYGGRGIKFRLSMNETIMLWERDSASQMKSPSIDRKNNDGDYEYSNCQFLEMGEHTRKTWLGRHHSEKSKKLMRAIRMNKKRRTLCQSVKQRF